MLWVWYVLGGKDSSGGELPLWSKLGKKKNKKLYPQCSKAARAVSIYWPFFLFLQAFFSVIERCISVGI